MKRHKRRFRYGSRVNSCWRDCGTQRSFGETGPFWCTFDQVCPAWVATPQSVWRWEDTWLSRWRIRLGIWCSKCLCHSKIKWCQSFAALKRICIVSWMVSWQPMMLYIYIHAVFGLYIHMGICDWISCISARVFMRYIASENVNPRLMSTPGCPIQVSRYSPTSDQLLTDCIGFAALWGSQEAIAQRMDFSQVAILQTVNACQVLLHKLDSSQDVCQMENTGEMVWQVLFREMFL